MPRTRRVNVFQLNVAANPHEDGVYERLLERAASILVQVRASDYGKLTKPTRSVLQRHLLRGRVLVWTEIDLEGRWIDLQSEDDLSEEQRRTISIPETAKPNFRSFDFVFDLERHVLYFESRNDLNQTITPQTVLRLVSRAFAPEALGAGWPEVAVTLVPEVGVVDRILSLPRLHTLFISVVRPNPDAASPEAVERIWKKLDAMHAHRLDTKIRKAADADHLVIDGEYRELAEVGAENGLVAGKGKNTDGSTAELSTAERPKAIPIEMDKGQDLLARLLSFIPGLGQG